MMVSDNRNMLHVLTAILKLVVADGTRLSVFNLCHCVMLGMAGLAVLVWFFRLHLRGVDARHKRTEVCNFCCKLCLTR